MLKPPSVNAAGKAVAPVLLKYGAFINTVIEFAIVALVFLLVKAINAARRQQAAAAPPPASPGAGSAAGGDS